MPLADIFSKTPGNCLKVNFLQIYICIEYFFWDVVKQSAFWDVKMKVNLEKYEYLPKEKLSERATFSFKISKSMA